MNPMTPTLHMMCGKVASGKSTLAAQLSSQAATILISEDRWLEQLFGDEMVSIMDFVRYSGKLRNVIGPHISELLKAGVSVVLDFQANTVEDRTWMRGIFEEAKTAHQLHWLDTPDQECLSRLRARNASGTHPFTVTEDQFRQVTRHFVAPSQDEGFYCLRYAGTRDQADVFTSRTRAPG